MNQTPNENKKDIFDRLMAHKEGLLYLFFGGVTTLVSYFIFWLFLTPLGCNELVANLISWVLAVLVAYLTNRTWVFSATAKGVRAISLEVLSFYGSRVATLLLEEGILFLFVTLLALPAMPVKIAASVLVVILNYVLSKLMVFRKGASRTEGEAEE